MELFDQPGSSPGPTPPGPLADRMRPRTLDEVVGQEHLLGPGRVLRTALERGELHSMILWGPPGSGKTTLASLMARIAGARFVTFSAVLSGVKEIRQVVAEADAERARGRRRTILFVDEIHRFNRAQQDAFLPHVEKGDLVLIGATTENPSFAVNGALLSRCRAVQLQPLGEGGPGDSSNLLLYFIFQNIAERRNWGYVNAMTIILVGIVMIFTVGNFIYFERGREDEH